MSQTHNKLQALCLIINPIKHSSSERSTSVIGTYGFDSYNKMMSYIVSLNEKKRHKSNQFNPTHTHTNRKPPRTQFNITSDPEEGKKTNKQKKQ